MGEATKTISVIQSIVALVGLGMVLLLNLLPAAAVMIIAEQATHRPEPATA